MKKNYFLKYLLILMISITSSTLFGQESDATKNLNISEFHDYIKKAESDEAIKNYFNVTEIANIMLESRDEFSLNEFLKATDVVFGKTLIKGENVSNEYILVDFNVMYSANIILVDIKEVSNNNIVKNNTIEINY